jgi:predicted O-linked N-acetylglucosamine transferase (SPINDLY family)
LGNVLEAGGQGDEAIAAYRRAIQIEPDYVDAHFSLGIVLQAGGHRDEAIAAYRQAIGIRADYAEAHSNLGIALVDAGQRDEAIAAYRRAIGIKPDYADAHYNLGVALQAKGERDEAIAAYRQAIALKPDLALAHNNLGNALKDMERLDEAVACYRQAIRLKPDLAPAYSNLANVLTRIGPVDEAVAAFREANRLKPDDAQGHSDLIYALLFHPGYDDRMIRQELGRWNQRHAEPLKKLFQPHPNNRDPERRLRIGYVSADFYAHASAFFLLPLFRRHDRQMFELFCYSFGANSDRDTQRMKDQVQNWRAAAGLTDAQIAAQVREDQIDILVDLKLHTIDNHLLVFARKPAPVQVSWLGYPGTTGMDAMDYRLTDPYLEPPGLDDAYGSERAFRLPDTFWCYDPLASEPAVNALPCREKGFFTFGCLNNFFKVNDEVVTLWAGVLKAVANSRLLLMAPEGNSRRRVLDRLDREGIGPDRVEFVPRQSRLGYLQLYHRIDIGLDTAPCNGHTTSLDSFWMGVPVITLVGQTAVGRAGLSQLTNLGLPELIAQTPERYVQIAAGLAGDLPRLAALRRTLRARMEASPLMDAPRFARNIEAAYRQMWRNWCA